MSRIHGSPLGRRSVLTLAVGVLLVVGSRDTPQQRYKRPELVSFRLDIEGLDTVNRCPPLTFVFRDQNGEILPALSSSSRFLEVVSEADRSCVFGGTLTVRLPRAHWYTVEIAGRQLGPMSYDSIRSAGGVWRIPQSLPF